MLRVRAFIRGNRVHVIVQGTAVEVDKEQETTRVEIEEILEAYKDGFPIEQPNSEENRKWFCEIGMMGKSGDGYYSLVHPDDVEVLGVAASQDQISLFDGG